MKVRYLLTMLLLVTVLLASCAPAAPEEPPAPEEPAATEEPAEPEEPAEEPMEAVELRFSYYADGVEADVMQPILDDFMAANPDIKVVLDVVPYATIDEQLPVQVETGEGPDMARITNFGAYSGKLLDLRPLLEDGGFYEANFPAPILDALGYGGFPDAFTITGQIILKQSVILLRE